MRHIPTFVSIVALVWASAMTLRSERLPWIVPAYVVAQCVFALIAFLGLQRAILHSRGYTAFFFVTFSVVLMLALIYAQKMALTVHVDVNWLPLPIMLSAFGFHAWFLQWTLFHQYGVVPTQIKLTLAQGAILLSCGVVALISTALRLPPEQNVAALALGSFWLAMGALMWCWSVGYMRNQRVWLTLNDFLPAFLAIVAFGWMAFELGKAQSELSYQALPAVAQLERTVVTTNGL